MKSFALAGLLALAASSASAQVGYDPSKSPYRDLEKGQEITITTGQFRASLDPARVAPRTGPWIGVKYQWLIDGPVNFTADIARVGSERRVLDPLLPATCTGVAPADCKLIHMYRWPLYFFDAGLSLNLTGARSWHSLVPEVRGGLGLLSDFHTKADVGDFAVGTRFVLSYGTGVRYLVSNRYQLRFDVGDRWYPLKYPESYFTAAPDTSVIRQAHDKRSVWLHNAMLTLGVSYMFGGTP